jgi:hypothetical protein
MESLHRLHEEDPAGPVEEASRKAGARPKSITVKNNLQIIQHAVAGCKAMILCRFGQSIYRNR